MEITEVRRWVVGVREFRTPEDAQQYVDRMTKVEAADQVLLAGGTLGDACAILGIDCPERIAKVTQRTGFKIPHLQCSELYAYSVRSFEEDGRVYVGGHGQWSGHYGQPMNLERLAEYPFRNGVQVWTGRAL